MTNEEISEVVVDDAKLRNIIKNIIEAEKENVKTKESNENEMKKIIEKIIEEEVKCY